MSLPAFPAEGPAQPAAPPPYELPGAREIVGHGFELMVASTAQLRRTSLYFGGLFVAFLGPLLVLGVLILATAPPGLEDMADMLAAPGRQPAAPRREDVGWLTSLGILVFGLYIGLIGAAFVAAEGGIVAIAILAGRRLGRPIGLRQALIRSRQVFWRVVLAGILVLIPVSIGQLVLRGMLDATGLPDEGSSVIALLVATVLAAPWTYIQTGVILGDVGAGEAIRRSVRLFRARPWVGLAVALFPAIFNFVQLAGLSQGGDVLLRVAQATDLGFDRDLPRSAVTIVLILAAVAAAGSLLFTVGALFAAPQVVAFLGLTHYAGGLDQAAPERLPAGPAAAAPSAVGGPGAGSTGPPHLSLRGRLSPPMLPLARPPAPPPAIVAPSGWTVPRRDPGAGFHWVTRGMLAAIVGGMLLAAAGISNLAGRLAF